MSHLQSLASRPRTKECIYVMHKLFHPFLWVQCLFSLPHHRPLPQGALSILATASHVMFSCSNSISSKDSILGSAELCGIALEPGQASWPL